MAVISPKGGIVRHFLQHFFLVFPRKEWNTVLSTAIEKEPDDNEMTTRQWEKNPPTPLEKMSSE